MEKGEKMDVLTRKTRAEDDSKLIEKLNEENARLTLELSKVQQRDVKRESKETLRQKFEAGKQRLILENTTERSGCQCLPKEFNLLEQRNKFLEEQLDKYKGGNVHTHTASSVSSQSGVSDGLPEPVHDGA